jgi:hypothetical protein
MIAILHLAIGMHESEHATGASTNFKFLSPTLAAAKIRSIYYPSGGTNTQMGLAYARTLMKGNV